MYYNRVIIVKLFKKKTKLECHLIYERRLQSCL